MVDLLNRRNIMKLFYRSDGCDGSPAVMRELPGGDSLPIAVPMNDCTPDELAVMASGPELLEALEGIAACAKLPYPHGISAYAISNERMAKARAAIAKARGGVR